MTTPRRPIRHGAALVGIALVAVLALGGCTPSDLELENRTTKSAFKALTGQTASGDVTCALEHVGEEAGQQRYEGSCNVNGRSFRMTSFYAMGSGYSTAFLSAAVPRPGGKVFVHTCGWEKSGSKPWKTTSPCSTGEMPGT